jgi:chromosome segregation ATPase
MHSMLLRARLPRGWAACLAAGFLTAGCVVPINRDAVSKEVLDADPSFHSVLEKHRDLKRRIETLQRELSLKRSTVNQTIEQLREDLKASVAAVRAKTRETRAKIDPDRQRLAHALREGAAELKSKQLERAVVGRAMSQLKKSQRAGESAAGAPRDAQRDLESMAADAERLDHELAALREHIRLLKLKLLLTKL